MPIYEYRCSDCNHDFEELVLSPRESVSCPSCKSPRLERRPSLFASRAAREASGKGGCGCTPKSCACH